MVCSTPPPKGIVLCPKTIPKAESTYEGKFLFYFLRHFRIKAIVSNECWSAFKFRVTEKYKERFTPETVTQKVQEFIAIRRSWLQPETEILNRFGQDITPVYDYTHPILVKKTKDLIARKGAIIKYFITEEPDAYQGLTVEPVTLQDFFNDCVENYRELAEQFIASYPLERDGLI